MHKYVSNLPVGFVLFSYDVLILKFTEMKLNEIFPFLCLTDTSSLFSRKREFRILISAN